MKSVQEELQEDPPAGPQQGAEAPSAEGPGQGPRDVSTAAGEANSVDKWLTEKTAVLAAQY